MKHLRITVEGKAYDVIVEELGASAADPAPAKAAPAVSAAPSAPAPAAASGETVTCPMPGTILDVKVAVGNAVKKGDVLVVIEAMKMENEIKAPHDGTVGSVMVKKGDTAETGTPLVALN